MGIYHFAVFRKPVSLFFSTHPPFFYDVEYLIYVMILRLLLLNVYSTIVHNRSATILIDFLEKSRARSNSRR